MPNDKLETALQAAITILYILKKKEDWIAVRLC